MLRLSRYERGTLEPVFLCVFCLPGAMKSKVTYVIVMIGEYTISIGNWAVTIVAI